MDGEKNGLGVYHYNNGDIYDGYYYIYKEIGNMIKEMDKEH